MHKKHLVLVKTLGFNGCLVATEYTVWHRLATASILGSEIVAGAISVAPSTCTVRIRMKPKVVCTAIKVQSCVHHLRASQLVKHISYRCDEGTCDFEGESCGTNPKASFGQHWRKIHQNIPFDANKL